MNHRIWVSLAFVLLLLLVGCEVQGEPPAGPDRLRASEARDVAAKNQSSNSQRKSANDEELKFEELVLNKMQEKVTWHLGEEKLADVVERLKKELGVPIVLDKNAVNNAQANVEAPIDQDLDGVTRELALDMVLRPYGLDWTISGAAVVISSHEEIEKALATRVYDVEELVAGNGFEGGDVDSLIDAITSTVSTSTWVENGGGEAEIRPLRVNGRNVLIISQSLRTHQKIRELLRELRSVQGKTPSADRPPISTAELRDKLGALREAGASNLSKGSDLAATDVLLLESDALKDAVKRSNQFSLDLFRRVTGGSDHNDLVSGYSAREALFMATLGANGETRAELERMLRLSNDPLKAGGEAFSLRSYVQGSKSSGSVFEVANSLWVQPEMKLKDDYAKKVQHFMDATAQSVDFRRPANAVEAINGWAAKKTHQRIPEILSKEDITPQTNLILVNAVYFLGKWQTAFDAGRTKPGDFTSADGTKRPVSMMNGEIGARYAVENNSELQIAELPYRGRTKSLVILLPARGKGGLAELKKQLDIEKLEKWLAETARCDLAVRLPKFSFTTNDDLNSSIAAMGGDRVFNPRTADFSGMTDSPSYLQKFKQAAFIKVDETGTEAAAVTAESFGGGASPKSRELIVDRPFLFLIRDLTTGCILFVGQVSDPRFVE